MPTTISSYHSFVSGGLIKSSEVNTNFLNHRGTQLPISESTAVAENITHDLGTTEYRWANTYTDKIYLGQSTTSWAIQDDTTSVGDLVFKLNGSTVARIDSGGFVVSAAGSLGLTSASSTFSITTSDDFVTFDSSSDTFTAYLHTPVGNKGVKKILKKITNDFNPISITQNGVLNVDDTVTTSLDTINETLVLVSDNVNWVKESRYTEGTWRSYTPTMTNFGTVSNVEASWRRVGDSIEVQIKFTSGSSTAAEARFGLPSGLTTAGTSKIPSIMAVGALAHNTATARGYIILAEPSVAYLTLGIQSVGAGGLNKANANNISSGEIVSLFAKVAITGWKG